MLKLPKILVLDYRKWICGSPSDNDKPNTFHGTGVTELLNNDGYMCCLGQFACQSGVKKDNLIDNVTPCELNLTITGLNYKGRYDTSFSEKAGEINDNEETTIAEKAHKLTLLCSKYKRTLLLKNFPQSVLKEIRGKYNVWKSGN